MWLGELLSHIGACQTRRRELAFRIQKNLVVSEETQPVEDANALIEQYHEASTEIRDDFIAINRTNLVNQAGGMPLVAAVAERELLDNFRDIITSMASKSHTRAQSRNQIKLVPVLRAQDLREWAENVGTRLQKLKASIDHTSWDTEILHATLTEFTCEALTDDSFQAVDMTLAEAIAYRRQLRKHLEGIEARILDHRLLVQEGDRPVEDPEELIRRYERGLIISRDLIAAISLTNALTSSKSGTALEIWAELNFLNSLTEFYWDVARAAVPVVNRRSAKPPGGTEIRKIVTIDVQKFEHERESLVKRRERTNRLLQRTNCETTLIAYRSSASSLENILEKQSSRSWCSSATSS